MADLSMSAVTAAQPHAGRRPSKSLKSEFVAFKAFAASVEVASHLFYDRGYSSCTLDDVADRLGGTKPCLTPTSVTRKRSSRPSARWASARL